MKALRESIMIGFADPLDLFAYQKSKVDGVVLDWSATTVLFHGASLRK